MPNYFEISPTDDVLTLQQGQGAAGFAVRYVGERSVEAKAKAVALQGAEQAWLQVAKPATKDMQSNQTQTFKVLVNVPPGTSAGRYGLRLDVMSEDNTDEEYNQGPVISFEVPELSEPAPKTEKGFPWWIIIVAAVILALAAGGIAWWLVARNDVDPLDSPAIPLVSQIDFSEAGGGFFASDAYLSSGIAVVEAKPQGSYCAGAVPTILPVGRYRLPNPALSTASPGNLNSCNAVNLVFRLQNPASKISIEFFGANTSYLLSAYDNGGNVVASDKANATPYNYSTPSTVTVSSEETLIDHFEFGHQGALTMIQSIEITTPDKE
ncbi:MAG: hypothetical protein BA869_12590 [Desulfuromonadales bacterium C00003107]|jgi:hypothetical protein|nr:MAG: hypothetical protein BA869_12590 [Desulfuromonadales bacterium C00003107]